MSGHDDRQLVDDLAWLGQHAGDHGAVFVLKADGEREDSRPNWTAAILGQRAEHATTPYEAAAKLRASLENR